MSAEEIILALKVCFINLGLNPVVRSPIRLEVFVDNHRVGEVYLIDDTVDNMVHTACDGYEDLFASVCVGFRIGWKAAKGDLPVEA